MNTFLSDYNLQKNAKNLDDKRLFCQLKEGKQILDIIVNKKGGAWSQHPAILMWKENPIALFWYLRAIWKELQNRKIALDSKLFYQCGELIVTIKLGGAYIDCDESNRKVSKFILPKWWGDKDIIRTHRSRLKCKGLIDVYCAAIKKHFKIKSINKWLKANFGKEKNQLRYSDALKLENIINQEERILYSPKNNGPVIKVEKNHYDIKEWGDVPFDLDYIWPN